MGIELDEIDGLDIWRRTLRAGIERGAPDLSVRQMAILLTVYLTPPPHTVRGLAERLRLSKPAVSRALDRLGRIEMVRRKTDEADRRNVLVQRTVRGTVFLREFAELIVVAGRQAGFRRPAGGDAGG